MIEPDVICMALWAVAPIYVAVRRATRRATPPMPHAPPQRRIPRPAVALLFLVVVIWLGTRQDLATAVVTALAASTAVASVMVLLVPARPRVARILAVLAPCIAAITMLCAGGCHGA